ncbi:MAG: quaternary amine ABC transporter ATP-binding protein [Bacillota bacterium]
MAKVTVDNLYKIFGKSPEQVFPLLEEGFNKDEIMEKTGNTIGVNDASFSVEEGEIFVIMGLSGSGKSTLLRCINRLMEPTRGDITVDGTDLMQLNKKELRKFRRDEFGMVFQNFALFPNRTVLENVEFGLEIQKVPKAERREASLEALNRVGLEGWEDQSPQQLSGGMQQRVGLARALAVDPEILLMDEPFSALDPLIKKEMQDKLLDLYEEMKKTILFITHDLDEALKLGDRVAIMKAGKIVQIGNHEQILTNAANDYVEDFVRDVNRSRVLTARDIMTKPLALVYERDEGPRTALHKMKNNSINSIFVVGENRRFRGIILIDDILEAINRDQKDLEGLVRETKVAHPEENLDQLFTDIADMNTPLPVVGDNGRLEGIIVKTNVIANLASDNAV